MSEGKQQNLTFSQREGLEVLPPQMQVGELSEDVRREIWNRIWRLLESQRSFGGGSFFLTARGQSFARVVIGRWLRIPEDQIDTKAEIVYRSFKDGILKSDFNEVLDLLEIIVNLALNDGTQQARALAPVEIISLFEDHAAPYYLEQSGKKYQFQTRTSKQERDATLQSLKAVEGGGFEAALSHLDQAAEHMRAKINGIAPKC